MVIYTDATGLAASQRDIVIQYLDRYHAHRRPVTLAEPDAIIWDIADDWSPSGAPAIPAPYVIEART